MFSLLASTTPGLDESVFRVSGPRQSTVSRLGQPDLQFRHTGDSNANLASTNDICTHSSEASVKLKQGGYLRIPNIPWALLPWLFVLALGYFAISSFISCLVPFYRFGTAVSNGISNLPGRFAHAAFSFSIWSVVLSWPRHLSCKTIGIACQLSPLSSDRLHSGVRGTAAIETRDFDLGIVANELFHEATSARSLVDRLVFAASGSSLRYVMKQSFDMSRISVELGLGTRVSNRDQLRADTEAIEKALHDLLHSLIVLNGHGTRTLSFFIEDFVYLERFVRSLGPGKPTPDAWVKFQQRLTTFIHACDSRIARLSVCAEISYNITDSIVASQQHLITSLRSTAEVLRKEGSPMNPLYRWIYPLTIEGRRNADDKSLLLDSMGHVQDMKERLYCLVSSLDSTLDSARSLQIHNRQRRIDEHKDQGNSMDPREELDKFQAVVLGLAESQKTFPTVFNFYEIHH